MRTKTKTRLFLAAVATAVSFGVAGGQAPASAVCGGEEPGGACHCGDVGVGKVKVIDIDCTQ